MIQFKLWRTVGAAALLGASVACTPVAEKAETAAPAPEAAGEAGEAASGESGGEHGEAGVATAYAGLEGPARTALGLQHLKGFVLVARQVAEVGTQEEAGALVGQGLLEVYTPAQDQFGGFNAAPVQAAEAAGMDAKPKRELAAKLDAAVRAISAAQAPLHANPADLAVRMIDLSTGLYGNVVKTDFVDPIEYQHSLGAALSARDALVSGAGALRARDAARYDEALGELNRFVALWPQPTAPEAPTPNRDVLAQASRAKLALSGFLD
ncbi:MAG: hypothetical protein JNJ73_15890 [Hyphomonadaceae bacterium]|nr:hypothetical protein [Hyphomonadaceae bacterium]